MDNSLIHADIFFLITSVAVIIITVLVVIVSVYVFIILSNVRHISNKARIEANFWADEMSTLRRRLHTNRYGVVGVARFIRRIFTRYY